MSHCWERTNLDRERVAARRKCHRSAHSPAREPPCRSPNPVPNEPNWREKDSNRRKRGRKGSNGVEWTGIGWGSDPNTIQRECKDSHWSAVGRLGLPRAFVARGSSLVEIEREGTMGNIRCQSDPYKRYWTVASPVPVFQWSPVDAVGTSDKPMSAPVHPGCAGTRKRTTFHP